jgi:hypothetical protein
MGNHKIHHRHGHGGGWMPFAFGMFFLMFMFWGGWKLFAFIPFVLIGLSLFFWFSKANKRQWREWKHWSHEQWGDWRQHWGDESADAGKPKHGDGAGTTYEAKRKNDDDVYYV